MSDLTLVPVSEESVPLLARWLSDPRVLEFYEGRDPRRSGTASTLMAGGRAFS